MSEPAELTPNQEIKVLEQFMDLADYKHSVGHIKAALEAETTKKKFVPEEHWAWAASKAREVIRQIRETGKTLAGLQTDQVSEQEEDAPDGQ